jgi:hypothetical protein
MYDAIHQFILKLIQKLETERTRLDTKWNSPKARLPLSTFAEDLIQNLERLVAAIESGASNANVRELTVRRVGALRNVAEKEKSKIAERFLYAPDLVDFVKHTEDLDLLGEEGDEEIIFTILDRLVGNHVLQRAFDDIIIGAIEGNHRALFEKLINDERFTPNENRKLNLMYRAAVMDRKEAFSFLIHHTKLRLTTGDLRYLRRIISFMDEDHSYYFQTIDDVLGKAGGARRQKRITRKSTHRR